MLNYLPYGWFHFILRKKGLLLHFTHFCCMGSSTSTLWTGPFPVEEVSGFFLFITMFYRHDVFNANSVDSGQMLQHLIWVYTVCKCPFYGMLGINGLSCHQRSLLPVWYFCFQAQRYEAASTIFGPHTLEAYIQVYTNLSVALAKVGT